jgi:hypothetical protein
MPRSVREIVQGLARGIAATVAGVLLAGLTIAGVEWLGHRLYPPPAGLKADDLEAMAAHVAAMPIGALLFVLLAWLLIPHPAWFMALAVISLPLVGFAAAGLATARSTAAAV